MIADEKESSFKGVASVIKEEKHRAHLIPLGGKKETSYDVINIYSEFRTWHRKIFDLASLIALWSLSLAPTAVGCATLHILLYLCIMFVNRRFDDIRAHKNNI